MKPTPGGSHGRSRIPAFNLTAPGAPPSGTDAHSLMAELQDGNPSWQAGSTINGPMLLMLPCTINRDSLDGKPSARTTLPPPSSPARN